MKLADFNYNLPKSFIAQKPVSPKDHSKLMVLNPKIEHKHFYDLINYLKKGDVLVINETKVIPNKIVGKKLTGSSAELIISETKGKECICSVKTRNPFVGTKLIFGKYKAKIIKIEKDNFVVLFDKNVKEIIKKIGILPTPPYVKRKLKKESEYQTVYSRKKGSVAAPTAGLHFTKKLLNKIKKKQVKIAKVCLHIDFGTFLPVKNIKNHKMHEEYFEIDPKNAKIINKAKRIIVVGTTCVRTLESCNKNGKILPKKGKTNIFIKPGYKFKTKIDALITNFHLPESTLLMLVSAFYGRKKVLGAYKEAIKYNYRFYSLGDATLLIK